MTDSVSNIAKTLVGSDYTMYPFSTQHAEVVDGKTRTSKDFSNLLSVYLDSVFFPRIRKMDFLQVIPDRTSGACDTGLMFMATTWLSYGRCNEESGSTIRIDPGLRLTSACLYF